MAFLSCIGTRPLVPGTPVGSRPLEHLEMASLSCIGTRRLIPGTAVGPCPLEHVMMACPGCPRTSTGPRDSR
jgi:hypothetical protein